MFSTGSNRYRLAFGDATIADILGLSMAGNAFIAMHIVNIITVLVIVLGNVAVVKLNWRSGESCVKSSDMLPKRIYCVKIIKTKNNKNYRNNKYDMFIDIVMTKSYTI